MNKHLLSSQAFLFVDLFLFLIVRPSSFSSTSSSISSTSSSSSRSCSSSPLSSLSSRLAIAMNMICMNVALKTRICQHNSPRYPTILGHDLIFFTHFLKDLIFVSTSQDHDLAMGCNGRDSTSPRPGPTRQHVLQPRHMQMKHQQGRFPCNLGRQVGPVGRENFQFGHPKSMTSIRKTRSYHDHTWWKEKNLDYVDLHFMY